ncbi:unnamed protein product [Caenorhabditis auriculariae]|uniref:Uncharacterized protein n=1 Tax=Caenorhabditis auriculariae TaxID=2777116 RepID=A0A8S1GX63_9PELO|nr:unnamed protein product [Caenorhabditis auriculariae]
MLSETEREVGGRSRDAKKRERRECAEDKEGLQRKCKGTAHYSAITRNIIQPQAGVPPSPFQILAAGVPAGDLTVFHPGLTST